MVNTMWNFGECHHFVIAITFHWRLINLENFWFIYFDIFRFEWDLWTEWMKHIDSHEGGKTINCLFRKMSVSLKELVSIVIFFFFLELLWKMFETVIPRENPRFQWFLFPKNSRLSATTAWRGCVTYTQQFLLLER